MNPKVTSAVNRNLDEFFLRCAWKGLRKSPEPWDVQGTGRPPYDPKTVALACMAKLLLNKTYEATESWTAATTLFTELTGYDRIPQSVIQRGMEKLPMRYVRQFCKRLTIEFRRKGIDAVADSSGMRLRTSSSWYDIRIRRMSRRKDHLKVHIVGDIRFGLIHNFTITGGYASDGSQLKKLLSVIKQVLRLAGDTAYSSRVNCTLVSEKGGKPFFRLQKNATAKPKSSPAWKATVRFYRRDPEGWLKEYHIRSYVEAIFASIKKRFGNFLRSIKRSNQERELSLKVVCYNIVRVLYIETAKRLGVPLWVKA